jgi:hypothetical protein
MRSGSAGTGALEILDGATASARLRPSRRVGARNPPERVDRQAT